MVTKPTFAYNVNYKTYYLDNFRYLDVTVPLIDTIGINNIAEAKIYILDRDDRNVATYDLQQDALFGNVWELRHQSFTDDGNENGNQLIDKTYHYIITIIDGSGIMCMQTGIIYNYWEIDSEYLTTNLNNSINNTYDMAANAYSAANSAYYSANNAYNIVNSGTFGNSVLNTKLNTIDGIVDDILVDTGTTIPGLIADLDTLIKTLRKKNLYYEFTIATEINETRNVEIGDLDHITYKTKADSASDWSAATSTGVLYVWYNETGADKEIVYIKEQDT